MAEQTETKFVTVKVPTDIPEQRVRDLLCSALEGGSNYWYSGADHHLRDGLEYKDFQEGGSQTLDDYFHPYELIPFVEGCHLTVKVDMGGDEMETHKIDRDAMKRGIRLMAEEQPRHFQNFINEDDDAETADVFLQLALFGELVFG